MSIYNNINGAYKTVNNTKLNIDGTWRDTETLSCNINGCTRTCSGEYAINIYYGGILADTIPVKCNNPNTANESFTYLQDYTVRSGYNGLKSNIWVYSTYSALKKGSSISAASPPMISSKNLSLYGVNTIKTGTSTRESLYSKIMIQAVYNVERFNLNGNLLGTYPQTSGVTFPSGSITIGGVPQTFTNVSTTPAFYATTSNGYIVIDDLDKYTFDEDIITNGGVTEIRRHHIDIVKLEYFC